MGPRTKTNQLPMHSGFRACSQMAVETPAVRGFVDVLATDSHCHALKTVASATWTLRRVLQQSQNPEDSTDPNTLITLTGFICKQLQNIQLLPFHCGLLP